MQRPGYRKSIALAALMISGLLAVFFLRPKPDPAPLAIPSPDLAATTKPQSAPPLLQAPSAPLPVRSTQPPTPAAPLAFPPSELLLRARAGSFTPEEVTAAVAAFNAQTPEALAELARLTASTNTFERLLALYLRLEIEGPTSALLASAASDPSTLVSAQAAEWLFFHSRFDLWKSYVQNVRAAWTPAKTEQVIASLADSPTGSSELPAGLVILQLGRALPDMVGALLNAAPEIRATLETALLDPSTSPDARTALLDTFNETRPTGYLSTLEKLLSARGEDSPARFKAFVNYAGVADASAGKTWLESIAVATTPADPLAFRFDVAKRLLAEKAASPIALTRADTRDRIKAAITSATSLRALSEADLRTLNRYVEEFRDFTPERADAPALERIATLLEAEPYRDYSARRLTARIRALVAQASI